VALFLCGCSQTTVHLYSRYLSDAQIEEINKELIAADFIVKPNHLAFPKSITQSSLTYSPVIEDRSAVNKVINELNNIGWQIHHTSMLFVDNHWYKENSIALMLLPLGVNPQAQTHQKDWAHEYTSQNCDSGLTINLEQNGQYQIETVRNLPAKHDYATGKWHINVFPYLELRAKDSDWGVLFELSTRVNSDQIGEVQISELTPLNNYLMFAGCTFEYGIRK
jgi:hypothetical protein